MLGWSKVVVVMLFAIGALGAIACEGKKDPLVPDNPSSDPLMLDGGAPPAPSAEPPK